MKVVDTVMPRFALLGNTVETAEPVLEMQAPEVSGECTGQRCVNDIGVATVFSLLTLGQIKGH